MAVAPEAGPIVLERGASEVAEVLFQEHSGWIYGYCLRLLRSPEEAEDALQTTYLNACRSLGRGTRPRVGSAWLLRIARNVCLARLRSSGRRGQLERVQDITILEETVAAPERSSEALMGLAEALGSLPDRQREAILLREWQGLSYGEVAERLGLTGSATETLIFRARRSLACALEDPPKGTRSRPLHALDLGGILAAVKGFLAGSASVKTAAAVALATATTATVVATDPSHVWRDRHDAVRAEPTVRESQPVRPLVSANASLAVPDESTRRPGIGAIGLKADPGTGGSVGRSRASAAKNRDGQSGGNGRGNAYGKASAPGQAKAKPRRKGAADRGARSAELVDRPGKHGPPPHAQAKGLRKETEGKGRSPAAERRNAGGGRVVFVSGATSRRGG